MGEKGPRAVAREILYPAGAALIKEYEAQRTRSLGRSVECMFEKS